MEDELLVELLEDYAKEYVLNEAVAGSFERYYTGLVLDVSLAEALNIRQVFDAFNAHYCWIPTNYF